MSQVYNIPEFLHCINIHDARDNRVYAFRYSDYPDILLKCEGATVDFYYLSIKTGFDLAKERSGMSDAFLFIINPGTEMSWDVERMQTGYGIMINAALMGKLYGEHPVNYSPGIKEALYLTVDEKETLIDLFRKALSEYDSEQTSINVLMSYASLILSYTENFYKRQFETQGKANNKAVSGFFKQLDACFRGSSPMSDLPSVAYFAEKANMSANYFGDVIKHFTGSSPQEHIRQRVVAEAKKRLKDPAMSVSEIAYSIGFGYPTYFTRFFRKETGMTPTAFRNQ